MSGIRSAKVADGLRHEYVTQNGRVVRETVYALDNNTGEYNVFQYALDFTYDEAGHPLTMRKYNNANMQNNYITMQYVCNAQGDVVKLIYNGTVYAEYTYDAWGKVLTATENGSYNYAALNPLRYRGYYYDTETGFYYLQSRYFDPIVKRFLNADSYSSTDSGFVGYNMFAYCNNNPAGNQDSSGDILITTLILIGAIVVGGGVAVYTGVKARQAGCGWGETILHSLMNGLMAFATVYTYGMTAYGCYQEFCYLHGMTPVTEIGGQSTLAVTSQPVPSISQSTQDNPLTDLSYTEKVEQQRKLEDFHSFSPIVDNYGGLGTQTQFIGGDGNTYTKLQILGSYKTYDGYFTYIWDANKVCNHRCFEMIK